MGQIYDIAIIGGGINGVGIARDAAGRGASVCLFEQGDLAEGTSSRSSKLIHGGLRYLEHYEFRLVREALQEREILLSVAPHVVWPLRFVLPHVPSLRPVWLIRLGLFLYDFLAARKSLPKSKLLKLRDCLQGKGLTDEHEWGFEYSDCWVDDARFVVLNALDAASLGAEIKPRHKVLETKQCQQDGEDCWRVRFLKPDGQQDECYAKSLVNAAGPWVRAIRDKGLETPPKGKMRLVQGSHIVVPKFYEGDQCYILQNDDERIVFALPYDQDTCLVGTTDQSYRGDPALVEITAEERTYLLQTINRYFKTQVTEADIIWDYSGVRPLYDDETSNVSEVTRDYVLQVEGQKSGAPMLSIYGGKLTTYRRLAKAAISELTPYVEVLGLSGKASGFTSYRPIAGGDLGRLDFDQFVTKLFADYPAFPKPLLRRYARSYGSLVKQILPKAGSAAAKQGISCLGEMPIEGLYEAEIRYLISNEWACTAEDILWRRTKLGLGLSEQKIKDFSVWLQKYTAAHGL